MVAPIGLADVVRRGQKVDEDVGRPVGERHVDLAKVAVEAVFQPPDGLRQRLAAGELVRVGGFALADLDEILGVPERPQHMRIERLEEALEDRLRDVALFLVADGRVELLPDLAEEGLVVVEGELAEVFEEGAAGLGLLHRHVAGRPLIAETAQTGTERLVEAQPVAAQHLARELRAEIVDDLPMRIGDSREPDGGDAVVRALAGCGKNLPRVVDGDAFRLGADRREQQRERRLLGNAAVGVDAAPEITALHVLIVDDGEREKRHVAGLQLAAGRELEGEIVSPGPLGGAHVDGVELLEARIAVGQHVRNLPGRQQAGAHIDVGHQEKAAHASLDIALVADVVDEQRELEERAGAGGAGQRADHEHVDLAGIAGAVVVLGKLRGDRADGEVDAAVALRLVKTEPRQHAQLRRPVEQRHAADFHRDRRPRRHEPVPLDVGKAVEQLLDGEVGAEAHALPVAQAGAAAHVVLVGVEADDLDAALQAGARGERPRIDVFRYPTTRPAKPDQQGRAKHLLVCHPALSGCSIMQPGRESDKRDCQKFPI